MTVLDEIVAGVAEDLASRRASRPLNDLIDAASRTEMPREVLPALRQPGLAVIAEVKRSSPSKGALAPIQDPAALAAAYARGGATAISVLTEQRRFGGSLADLRKVRSAVNTPVLRKDFVIDPYQLWEAREAGADLVLLIVAALSADELAQFLALAKQLGLTALVEAHTPDEVRAALDVGAELVGVNNRNLKTLEVDLANFEMMSGLVGDQAVKVAESGILSVADAARMRRAGADAILVGELLVRHGDPQAAVAELRSLV
jgi:indole-3-glycerol phosphate synthase